MHLELDRSEEHLVVAKMPLGVSVAIPPDDDAFFVLSKTPGCSSGAPRETTIVCDARVLPTGCSQVNKGWTGFMVKGPLDFSLKGIMANLSTTLADSDVSLYAISTYDTDWILVKNEDADKAEAAFIEAGHTVTKPEPRNPGMNRDPKAGAGPAV